MTEEILILGPLYNLRIYIHTKILQVKFNLINMYLKFYNFFINIYFLLCKKCSLNFAVGTLLHFEFLRMSGRLRLKLACIFSTTRNLIIFIICDVLISYKNFIVNLIFFCCINFNLNYFAKKNRWKLPENLPLRCK